MPKFVQDVLDNLDIDTDIEHLYWTNVRVEIPEFFDDEPELYIPDAYVPDNIVTL